ncbi:hypothetical protein LRAMOSA07441 [Lichtheimia ramosa]|uniref:pectinesterase n=1 Tax=Lichtheimia ramosa TaxID=688394 RepID=A0A077WAX9_9FUNG|nr:hypothetical protein LRAMOSA07441 [Lichtheimia ramosa]
MRKHLVATLSLLINCVWAATVKVSLDQSIQDAIDSLPADNSASIIEIESGVYDQSIIVKRPNIVFRPSNEGRVTLKTSIRDESVVLIESAAENVAFYDFDMINTIGEAAGNQRALKTYGAKLALYNCKVIGFGDTAQLVRGSGYFYNTWVEGTVDFIYGEYDLYCEGCTIAASGKGALTAASTLADDVHGGFVFHAANLTPVVSSIYDKRQENDHSYSSPLNPAEYQHSTILGRPWHNAPRVYFLESYIYDHIQPYGYDAWEFTDEELAGTFYAEYGNKGPGADTSKRVSWAHQLNADEAAPFLSAKTYFDNLNIGTDWIDSAYL